MNTSDDTCKLTGRYSAYSSCGHMHERTIQQGEQFPKCLVCGNLVAWTLLRETDSWGVYEYQWESSDSAFRGMTVNERLLAAGYVSDFEQAVQRRDRANMVLLLQQVGISLPGAERIADSLLSHNVDRSIP